MSGIRTEHVLVYRAPLPGAQRRMTRHAALMDWARAIIRDAPCRGGECYLGSGTADDPSDHCERHYPAPGWDALAGRVARLLGRRP